MSWHNTELKTPSPCTFLTITFPLHHQSSDNTFEKSISTSCRLETHQNEFEVGQFLNDFSLYEYQQPGLFTNDFFFCFK